MADIESNIRFGVDTSDAIASIKMLQAQISAFQKQMASSSVANAESAKKLRRSLIDDLNATGQFSASIKTIKSTSDFFTSALEKNKLSMGEYFRFGASQVTGFRNIFSKEFNTIEKVARERVKNLQTQYISLGRDADGALKSIAVRPLKLDMESLVTQTAINAQKQQIFNQLLKQGSTNLLNFGKNTQWAGRQLMVGFTIPLSIFGTTASKTFMNIEEQAIRFKRVYGELFTLPEETDKMLESIKELGKEFTKYGVSVEKTLSLAADAAAMGKTGTDLLDQVTEANRLAVLGNVEQQQALETTISLTNAFGIATQDLAKKIDFLNAVENQTVVSIEDLTIAIPKAGPVVQQLGGDVEDLAFFLTAMKEGGINASEGANALKSGLASIINPTDVASTMLKTFGINIKEIADANRGDVKGLVLDFASALDKLNPSQRAQAIEQLFGKFQFSRLSTLFQNVIQEGTQASRILELTNATTQELAQLSSKELKRVEESTTFRFRKAIEEFQLAVAPVGEQFLKLITPIIEFATGIIEKFNSLSDGAKGFITGLTVLLGAIGPVALMTFGLLANGVANIIKGFAFVRELFLRTGKQSSILGEQFNYLNSEQLQASAVAASLDQVHQKLIQTFSSEAGAVQNLANIYRRAFNEQQRFDTGRRIAQQSGLKLASGIISVPGPKGDGDVVPAMLSPGEAVIPADAAKKYAPIIQGMIAGNIPGFSEGVFLGMPKKSKYVVEERGIADEIYARFLESNYKNVPPTNYGHQLAKSTGHSFPLFGVGGVYMSPAGKRVFVKPVLDEKAAVAEIRGTQIARQAHGLKSPAQRIVVMLDPTDVRRQRKFLALESELDSTFVSNDPMAVFNEDQYFKQLVASLLRVDKDLSASNVFGSVVADVGPAGVFTRASGLRDYADNLPSMEEQAMINLLGIKGGAKRAFAESTLALMAGLTPQQYHQRMISEIQQVLPLLKQTIASFKLSDPTEIKVYADMVKRLEQGLGVDWSKFHAIHSNVKISKKKQSAVPEYNEGVVSVPGPKGKGDVMPAMLSPGEAVIPAQMAKKYAPLIQAMISGNIPGFKKGVFSSQSGRFGQEGEVSAQASHFGMFAPSEMSKTLEELKDELEGFTADVYILGDKMKDGTREVTKISEGLAKFAGENKDIIAGGITYAGTTTIEAKDRNQAYNAANIKGAAFTLEEAAQSGKLAKAALESGSKASQRYAEQLMAIVSEGEMAEQALKASNSAENRLAFMRENAEKALTESFLAQSKVKSVAEAQALATDALAKVQGQLANLAKSGIDEEQLLQEAKKKYAVALIQSGTGEFAVGAPGTGGADLRDVGTGRGRSNLRRTFGPGEDPTSKKFAYGGRSTAAVSSALFNQLREEGESAVSAALKVVGSAAMTSIRKGLGIKSPSKEFKNISDSVSQGVRQGKDDAQRAGAIISESISDGALAAAPTQSGAPSRRARGETVPEVGKIIHNPTIPGNKEAKIQAKRHELLDIETQARLNNNKKIAESTTKLQRMNSLFMTGSFALSSMTGVLSMFGGQFAALNETIFKISGAMFTLMSVTQLLTDQTLLSVAAGRLKIANDAVQAAAGTAAAGGLLAGALRIGTFVTAFLGTTGLVVAGLAVLAGAIMLFSHVAEEQKNKINGLGNAAFLTAEKMKKAGELLGFTSKTVSLSERLTTGTAASRTAEEKTKIEELRSNEDFKTTFQAEINAIKNATITDAQTALASVAAQLAASGADQETVDAYVRALAQEAGRTDLNLSFATIDFTKQGTDQIIKSANNAANSFSEAFARGVTTTERFSGPAVYTGSGFKTSRVEVTEFSDELKQSAQLFAGVQASALQGLASGFQNGLISVDQFNNGLDGVFAKLQELNPDQLDLVLPSLYEKLGIQETMDTIPNVSDQLILLQATAAGVNIDPAELEALENANKKDIDSQRLANQVRQKLITQTEKQAAAQKKLNDEIMQEALINQTLSTANNQINERITALQQQGTAYDYLIDQGYSTENALKLSGDAALAAAISYGIAAKVGTDEYQQFLDVVKQIPIMLDLEKKAEKLNQTTRGTPQKSPYQQAIESLQEQRKEITNNAVAFTKLKKAGLDTASAMKAAEDPITAAAIASTKVATDKWEKLIKAIKTTQALLSKKEIQDLLRGGKIDKADKQAQAVVANALNNLGYTAKQIDEVLSDQKFTNTLAADLKDGKINARDLLNRLAQIKQMGRIDIDIALATKEGAAEEFQKKYDRVVGYLEAQKQVKTIEIEINLKLAENEIIVREAENLIAAIQYKIDDLEAELTGIEEKEEDINEKYENRQKALDDIAKANDSIAKQQNNQLTLADALSQGDIAAAARAVQEIRAQQAQSRLAKQGDLLEKSKEKELAAIRSTNGKSREQIEENIKKLKKDIFKIEEETLEPARERIRLIGIEKEQAVDSLNAQILRWEALAARVNQAKLTLTPKEISAMEYQAGLIADLLENWNKIEDKEAILKIIKKTIDESTGVSSSSTTDNTSTTSSTSSSTSSTTSDTTNGSTAVGNTTKTINPDWTTAKKALDNATSALQKWDTTKSNLEAQLNSLRQQLRQARTDSQRTSIENQILALQRKLSSYDGSDRRLLLAVVEAAQKKLNNTPQYLTNKDIVSFPSQGGGAGGQLFMASGGFVSGSGTATSDSISALLSDGEYVIRSSSVSKLGMDFLDLINKTGKIPGFAVGGKVNPRGLIAAAYMRLGGLLPYKAEGGSIFKPLGTDNVPAMLTPGEFVVRKYAVDNFGVDRLKAINSGTYNGDSMYNYEVNVNVQTDANPDQIARAVMGQIRQIESQRIRGNRF